MNPRIITLAFIACAMILSSTSCMAAQKRHKSGKEHAVVCKPVQSSPLFRVFLAYPGPNKTIGSEIYGIVKVKGDNTSFVINWDEPRGSLTSDFSPSGFWTKWGDGDWVKAKVERHGTRYVITIKNQKNNKEAMLSVMAKFNQVSTGYDEYGELVTDTQENVATATCVYKVKFYKN